jgi:transmembrane sensor
MITPELLTKLREGRCTSDELAALRTYFDQTARPALDRLLADDWLATDSALPDAGPLTVAEARQRVWQRLQASVEADAIPVRTLNSHPIRPVWRWAVAASVAGFLAVGSWLVWQRQTQPESPVGAASFSTSDGWLLLANETDKPQSLTLADGSTVRLLPKSQVRYPARFVGALRTVQLSGEAFFAVRPDAAHPFVVQTRSVLVRVLGTSFTVRDFANQPTAEVAVQTGRVSVSPADGKSGIVLIPNERATLTVANGRVVKALVEAPEVVNPKAVMNRFVFADTPVADVFGELERAYGVTIRHDRATLANCTITARLSEQPLFTKLDMICASIGASYRVDGTTVVVQSAGCE